MDFELTGDQAALQDAVRSFCAAKAPVPRLRALVDDGAAGAVDRGLWGELADLGVFSLRDAGFGWADAVLVFEELGRALVPGPLVWTHLAAGVVDGAGAGDVVVGGVDARPVVGTTTVVEHLAALDALAVVDDDGVRLVAPPLAGARALAPLDPLVPVHAVDAAALAGGERVGGPEAAAAWRRGGAALVAGYLLGVAEGALDLAVAYAGQRRQFDRPIGSFQAVKHLLADALVAVEVARSAAYAAGVTLDQPDVGPPERAVAAAKLLAAEAACSVARTGIQVHGGMGFTWEVDAHLFLKRAHAMEPLFGSRDEHADGIARALAGAR